MVRKVQPVTAHANLYRLTRHTAIENATQSLYFAEEHYSFPAEDKTRGKRKFMDLSANAANIKSIV